MLLIGWMQVYSIEVSMESGWWLMGWADNVDAILFFPLAFSTVYARACCIALYCDLRGWIKGSALEIYSNACCMKIKVWTILQY